jgi:hypothetical protein
MALCCLASELANGKASIVCLSSCAYRFLFRIRYFLGNTFTCVKVMYLCHRVIILRHTSLISPIVEPDQLLVVVIPDLWSKTRIRN